MLQVSIVSKTGYISGGILGKSASLEGKEKIAILSSDKLNSHIDSTSKKLKFYTELREKYEDKKILNPEKTGKYNRSLRGIVKMENSLSNTLEYLNTLVPNKEFNASEYLEVGKKTMYNCCDMYGDFKMCHIMANNSITTGNKLFNIISDIIMAQMNSLELHKYLASYSNYTELKESSLIEHIQELAKNPNSDTKEDRMAVAEMYKTLQEVTELHIDENRIINIYEKFLELYEKVEKELMGCLFKAFYRVYDIRCYAFRNNFCILNVDSDNWIYTDEDNRYLPFTLEIYCDKIRITRKAVTIKIQMHQKDFSSEEE